MGLSQDQDLQTLWDDAVLTGGMINYSAPGCNAVLPCLFAEWLLFAAQ
jgi:prolyl-tRNA synthetase